MRDTWVCIASGPSLTPEDVEAVKHLNVIAVNDNWKWLRGWRGTGRRFVYGCDPRWWDEYHSAVLGADLDAACWTQDRKTADKYNLNWIESRRKPNLSPRGSGYIHQGSNSGFQALNCAYEWSAQTVLLLGYDMTNERGKHWFGNHPGNMQADSPFGLFVAGFDSIDVPDLNIINCSRDTALTCFPRMTIDEALKVKNEESTGSRERQIQAGLCSPP